MFGDLKEKLAPTDGAVKLILMAVIGVVIFLLLQPSPTLRAAGALWLALP